MEYRKLQKRMANNFSEMKSSKIKTCLLELGTRTGH